MRTLIITLLAISIVACNNTPKQILDLSNSNDTTVTISKRDYDRLIYINQLIKEDSIKNAFENEIVTEENNEEYLEPEYKTLTFSFEKEIKLNKSGVYIVPMDKMWDIKVATGVNPLEDSAGTFILDCGGYLDIKKSYNHECKVVENIMTGEKFDTDEIQTVWYYVNSYPHLYTKEGHKVEYTRGSSKEILHIDQYTIHKP